MNGSVADVMKQVRERIVLHIAVTGDRTRPREAAGAKRPGRARRDRSASSSPSRSRQGIEDYTDLSPLLVQAGHKIKLFREEEVNLESAFMALTKGLGQRV